MNIGIIYSYIYYVDLTFLYKCIFVVLKKINFILFRQLTNTVSVYKKGLRDAE